MRTKTLAFLYRHIFKPVAFSVDPEDVHDMITGLGENLTPVSGLLEWAFDIRRDDRLKKNVLGVEFTNPIGLAAGFDYDGHLAQVLKSVGFGFNTVGTVTALPYEGNPKPRLARLPYSQSLLVNKGFKSEGAAAVAVRLDRKNLRDKTIGISIGSTNTPDISTISRAIEDYLITFNTFKDKPYVKYFELNVSCPNTTMTESFTTEANFRELLKAVASLHLIQPIFVKMPNEIEFNQSDMMVKAALEYGVRGFIFSNLVKNRSNPQLNSLEIEAVRNLKGNFSGRPTFQNSNQLITHTRQLFGNDIAIIGCGGVFSPADARSKFDAGADLVQLITGMIYQGPQLVSEIVNSL